VVRSVGVPRGGRPDPPAAAVVVRSVGVPRGGRPDPPTNVVEIVGAGVPLVADSEVEVATLTADDRGEVGFTEVPLVCAAPSAKTLLIYMCAFLTSSFHSNSDTLLRFLSAITSSIRSRNGTSTHSLQLT
jgi:hypothetical protein